MSLSHRDNDAPRILISAAEQSADLHAANLIRSVLEKCPNAHFVGVAGPQMISAGCEGIFDMTAHSAMLLSAIKSAGSAIAMFRAVSHQLQHYAFDAAVVIDSPTLHLPLSARTKAAGIPTLYYIAPQMWAWGTYRIHKLRNQVDRVAAILPFEEKFFRDQGVNATYVGHPLAESVSKRVVDDENVRTLKGNGTPFISLLPGSRRHVVESVLPGQLAVARRIGEAYPKAAFGVSIANPQVAPIIERLIRGAGLKRCVSTDRHIELVQAADLVLVASGTTALEVAFYETPMIVMYNASRLFYQVVGRWLLHTRYLSLPNILAGREVVPEFMPYYTSTDPISERALALLRDERAMQSMKRDLRDTVADLRDTKAPQRTADMLLDMLKQHRH